MLLATTTGLNGPMWSMCLLLRPTYRPLQFTDSVENSEPDSLIISVAPGMAIDCVLHGPSASAIAILFNQKLRRTPGIDSLSHGYLPSGLSCRSISWRDSWPDRGLESSYALDLHRPARGRERSSRRSRVRAARKRSSFPIPSALQCRLSGSRWR